MSWAYSPLTAAGAIKAGQQQSGAAATAAGSETARTTTGEEVFAVAASGLTSGTSYKTSFVWSDGTNDSNVHTTGEWWTAHAITPSAGSVVLTGSAPTVVLTLARWITPAAGSVTLTGAAPTVVRS